VTDTENEDSLKSREWTVDKELFRDEFVHNEKLNYRVFNGQTDFESAFKKESVGSFIDINDAEEKSFLPEGWSGKLKEREFDATNKSCLLIRNATLDIIEWLKKSQADMFSNNYIPKILDGMSGVGKSAVLQSVVYWARKSGWIVLYIKNGVYWAQDGGIITKSKLLNNCWNQPWLSTKSFQRLIKAHGKQFAKIPIRNKFTMPNFSGKTLLDLAEYGSVMTEFATDAFVHLRNELSRTYEYPILIAVDNYNAFYNFNQEFRDPESRRYKKEKLPQLKNDTHKYIYRFTS